MEKFSSIKYIRQNLKDLGIDPNIISENKKLKKEIKESNHQLSLSKDENRGLSRDYWDINKRNRVLYNENKQQKELLDKIYQECNEEHKKTVDNIREANYQYLDGMRHVLEKIQALYPKEDKEDKL